MCKKIPDLVMACDRRFTAAHAQMCRLHLDAYDHLTGQIAGLDELVAEAAAPFKRLITRLVTISEIGQRAAEGDLGRDRRRHVPLRHQLPPRRLGRAGTGRPARRREHGPGPASRGPTPTLRPTSTAPTSSTLDSSSARCSSAGTRRR
jgi:hypothetical protein